MTGDFQEFDVRRVSSAFHPASQGKHVAIRRTLSVQRPGTGGNGAGTLDLPLPGSLLRRRKDVG